MERLESRKRSVEEAFIATNETVIPIQVSIFCEYCGDIIEANQNSNKNKVMAGHLRHCLSDTKGMRVNRSSSTITEQNTLTNDVTTFHGFGSDETHVSDGELDEIPIIQ